MWRKVSVYIVLCTLFVSIFTPIVHLSGTFPQLFQFTAKIDGKLRGISAHAQRLTGIKISGYWEMICVRSSRCEWISGNEFPEFILYPGGLVQDTGGTRALVSE